MRLASLLVAGEPVLGLRRGDAYLNLTAADPSLGTDVGALLRSGPDWKDRAAAAARVAEPVAPDGFRPLVPNPGKVLCLGLNDHLHAKEAGLPAPDFPLVFSRFASSLIGHGEPMLRPVESHRLDWEVELAVVIGTGGRRIAEADALDHVAGYTVFNDGTIRDLQKRTSQWTLGKNVHGTGALGPDLVTPDELPPGADGLRMTTHVDDAVMQDGTTATMIFKVAETIAILSQSVQLEPGDVIAMGTPSGVGHAMKPPRYLVPGETCRVAIEGIGSLDNPVHDDPAPTGASL